MNKYFLRVENGSFGFIVEGIHEITENDNPITQEEYERFFSEQSQGKQFRLKTGPTGEGLFDIIEEFLPPINTTPQPPTIEQRIQAIEDLMIEML